MSKISTNEWQLVGSLTLDREMAVWCLKGTLYVLGGLDEKFRSQMSVECYSPTEDKWIKKTTIPVKIISRGHNEGFTGCVLKLSKGVLDKL